ncbi:enolase-like isoform X2 [Rhopalosiphum padi]|uniref:enolase-like isoform X2 n=1 Tax=Rhopalosiphum padi TaxID=40932 RepID=UPI00298E4928|nr:enolase-like isoform X2 [Rhopalosiphum padi]
MCVYNRVRPSQQDYIDVSAIRLTSSAPPPLRTVNYSVRQSRFTDAGKSLVSLHPYWRASIHPCWRRNEQLHRSMAFSSQCNSSKTFPENSNKDETPKEGSIDTIKDAVVQFLKKLGDTVVDGAGMITNYFNCPTDDNNMTISKIEAYTILDSRGLPTVAVDLTIKNGLVFHAAVPSGASTGKYEALELRDNDESYFLGKGVNTAINNIENIIAPALVKSGLKVTEQRAIDDLMIKLDGTPNKSKLGANAILGVSIAVTNAGARQEGIPLYKHIANLAGNEQIALPVPAFNVINGGSHAGNKLAMQEFMILPTGARSFSEAIQMGSEVYQHLKNVIKDKYGLHATLVGDEGGFAPNIIDSKECLRLIETAIKKAGYKEKIKIGIDVAASEFYVDGGMYDLDFKNKSANKDKTKIISTDQLLAYYQEIVNEFPVITIEDPFDENHWEAWTKFTKSTNIQVVGDDLTVTNPIRITEAINKKACNCLLLKINQIGTITESIDAHLLAKKNGWSTMVSHRSGETEDTFIADLVVGLGAKEKCQCVTQNPMQNQFYLFEKKRDRLHDLKF